MVLNAAPVPCLRPPHACLAASLGVPLQRAFLTRATHIPSLAMAPRIPEHIPRQTSSALRFIFYHTIARLIYPLLPRHLALILVVHACLLCLACACLSLPELACPFYVRASLLDRSAHHPRFRLSAALARCAQCVCMPCLAPMHMCARVLCLRMAAMLILDLAASTPLASLPSLPVDLTMRPPCMLAGLMACVLCCSSWSAHPAAVLELSFVFLGFQEWASRTLCSLVVASMTLIHRSPAWRL
jgi:hypothetical protein